MNSRKKEHFSAAVTAINAAMEAVHHHNTSAALQLICKSIRHLTKVAMDLYPDERNNEDKARDAIS